MFFTSYNFTSYRDYGKTYLMKKLKNGSKTQKKPKTQIFRFTWFTIAHIFEMKKEKRVKFIFQ